MVLIALHKFYFSAGSLSILEVKLAKEATLDTSMLGVTTGLSIRSFLSGMHATLKENVSASSRSAANIKIIFGIDFPLLHEVAQNVAVALAARTRTS